MRVLTLLIALTALSAPLLGRQIARAQQPLAISLLSPADGATVNAPVRLRVEVGGGVVRPLGTGNPSELHYHVLVDVDPATVIQPGQPLPTGRAEVIHTDDINLMLGNLAPGRHTITVILTRADHVPLSPNIQHQATFTVSEAAAATSGAAAQPTSAQEAQAAPAALARTGRGGAMRADAPLSPPAALAAFALLTGIGGAALLARRRAGLCR